jgi:hypothetical protein
VWQPSLRWRDISDQVAREGYSDPPGLSQPKTQAKAAKANRLALLGFGGQDSGRITGCPSPTRFYGFPEPMPGTGQGYLLHSLTPTTKNIKNPRPTLAGRPGISCSMEGCGSLAIMGNVAQRNDLSVLPRHYVIPFDLAPHMSFWRSAVRWAGWGRAAVSVMAFTSKQKDNGKRGSGVRDQGSARNVESLQSAHGLSMPRRSMPRSHLPSSPPQGRVSALKTDP